MLRKTVLLLAALVLNSSAVAQGDRSSVSNPESWLYEPAWDGSFPSQNSESLPSPDRGAEGAQLWYEEQQRAAGSGSSSGGPVPMMRRAQDLAGGSKAIGEGAESIGKWLQIYDAYEDYKESFEALSNVDSRCMPNFSPGSSPVLPSACEDARAADGAGAGCGQCYTDAIDKLNFTRFYLEKLRCIADTTLTGAKKAMAFGDSASGIHGVSGLAWQVGGKPQIEKAVKEFRKTYDRKYQEYMRMLQGSLRDLGACEAQFMDNPDWYSRFGFIYYSFMEDRYRSPD
jgi:hypothetical protein